MIPIYGRVFTSVGTYFTSNPALVGKFVADPIWYPGSNHIVAGDRAS